MPDDIDRAGYFAEHDPYSRWGPSAAERQAARRDDDEDVRSLEADLWLLRHASVGQELGALDRVVARIEER